MKASQINDPPSAADNRPVPARARFIFTIVTVLYWTSLYTYVPILAPFLESLGASYSYVGLILGSYGLVQIMLRLPVGMLSDRTRRRKPYIMLGLLTSTLSCVIFALTEQLGWSLAARAVSGLSASTWVAYTVLFAGYYAKEDATKAMSTISFMTVTGQLIGMGVSGGLAQWLGWQAAFWAGSVAGIIGLIAAFWIWEPKEGIYRTPIKVQELAGIIRSKLLWKVSILSILGHCVLFITMFGFTPSYALTLDVSKSDLSLLAFAFMIPHAFASLYSGKRFAPRWGINTVMLVGFVISAICTFFIPFTTSFGMLMATQAVNGFAQGLHFPLFMGLAIQSVEQQKRATAMGLYQAVYAIGMFAGPFIAGEINHQGGLAAGFYVGAALAMCGAGLTLWWRSKAHTSI